ncbi:MAG: ABC transporter substrate-binding protein [Hyphomicrobiales bacterium]|nr:ABC transporter substrate-binding protein [Hyphomicrobiales bacterium]
MTGIKNNLPTVANLSGTDRETIETGLRRGANRREVMSWLIAAGASIAAAGSIVSTAQEALAATPKKGGRVKFASDLHGPSDTLDPGLNTSTIDYTRGRSFYNSLCQINDDLSTRPELAEEFSANSDNSEWTFKLRKDVKFHDGSPLTADDVIFSMSRHYGEKSTSTAKTLVADVKEWKKVDSHTVKAIMQGPNADLPVILGTPQFKIIKDGTTDFQTANGTGPFTLKEFSPGVRSIGVRNAHYWREGANVEEIEITAITDKVARTSALLSGDIDLMQALDPKAIRKVESTDGVGVWSVASGAYFGICAMTNTAPGNNPDFVKALQYIQRRKKIVKSVLKGQGTVGNDNPINIAYGADYCAGMVVKEHDLDKAKFHLKKSGITAAELNVAEVAPGLTDTCLLAQREAQKIGLDLQIKKVPNDGYWGAVWMKTPLNVVSWNMRPSANVMMNLAFAPDATWNDTLWKNERFGKLLVEVRGVTDASKRAEMYCEMQKMISEGTDEFPGSGMIIPAHRNYVDGKSDKVEGISRMPLGSLGGYEWPEFCWRTDA